MQVEDLLKLDDQTIRESLVEETNYGYILVTEDMRLLAYSKFITRIYPQIQLMVRGDSIVAFNPIMEEILFFDEGGTGSRKIAEGDYILDCKISEKIWNEVKYYFIEYTDETIKYEIMDTDTRYINQLKEDVRKTVEEVNRVQSSIVMGMATMVESRDNSTGGHVMRVSLGTQVFIERLRGFVSLKDDYWEYIKKSAPLHDIGKVAIDDDILRKPGRFTAQEFDYMKEHTTQGARILSQILSDVNDPEFLDVAVNVAKYHHEKYDGTGYPEGLKGDEIPFEARVLTLADVFDALVCRRVYKEAYDYNRAFKIIQEEMGKQFDPFLCDIFLDCKKDLIALYESISRD